MAGRPMKFDRQAAVEAAMTAYWQKGYANVSLNGLCAELGITRSSFYNTFGSLDQLFEESVDLYFAGAPLEQVMQAPLSLDSPTARIRASFQLLCKLRAKDPEAKGCLLVNSMGTLSTLSDTARQTVLDKMAKGRAVLEMLVASAIKAGELPKDTDAEAVVDALQALSISLNNISKLFSNEARLWRLACVTLAGLGLHDPGLPEAPLS